ncbi:MAG TPA: AraC family transcriptional regulator [Rubrivivax sp.]|nr:AraC family transcriptional regulator [Rubrivivax sp.]HPO19369.1 AraC family transcriptional regulator [Rubrivivax sp.]
MKTPVSVSIAFVQGMLAGVRSQRMAPEAWLAEAGIDPALLEQAGARVTGEQYVALYRVLNERLNDDGLGFYSRVLKRGSFTLILRSGLGAPDLEVAMRRIARTFGLLQDDIELLPLHDAGRAGWGLRFTNAAAGQPRFIHEMLLRIVWCMVAWLVARRLSALRFDLAFDRPPYADSYRHVLPGEVRFCRPMSALWFDAHALRSPIRRDEAALRNFVAHIQRNVVLPRRNDGDIGTRVRLHLQRAIPAWPDLESTARTLHMSASTLQRHLAAEQTTFQALKDELRRDLAIARLNTSMVPLAVIAGELGFSDSAAFQRAFKAWTGSPPGSYRRRTP